MGGNCLFTAVESQLQRYETQCGDESLRGCLVTFLQHHPCTNDGTTHLRKFVPAPVVSAYSYNADTEVPNDDDALTESFEGVQTQQELLLVQIS